ncbi:hypothetical protein RFI_28038 [Reticulomyxa filosa]|uniref:Uncharacterized protein n=1 Tax=Reticulomyxa filosa TaxID=46433 RepID=X6M8J4_RETFI|nr:hypothetical protein RFI_28038 [Reticulomyxa filosa]|eukprot:ETO09340.1 hypothetical protein RFI_28038 [Reticulomyxa filosa]
MSIFFPPLSFPKLYKKRKKKNYFWVDQSSAHTPHFFKKKKCSVLGSFVLFLIALVGYKLYQRRQQRNKPNAIEDKKNTNLQKNKTKSPQNDIENPSREGNANGTNHTTTTTTTTTTTAPTTATTATTTAATSTADTTTAKQPTDRRHSNSKSGTKKSNDVEPNSNGALKDIPTDNRSRSNSPSPVKKINNKHNSNAYDSNDDKQNSSDKHDNSSNSPENTHEHEANAPFQAPFVERHLSESSIDSSHIPSRAYHIKITTPGGTNYEADSYGQFEKSHVTGDDSNTAGLGA